MKPCLKDNGQLLLTGIILVGIFNLGCSEGPNLQTEDIAGHTNVKTEVASLGTMVPSSINLAIIATPPPTSILSSLPVPIINKEKAGVRSLKIMIREITIDIPKYDRKQWQHWLDDDKDCQNTRHEVLIEESVGDVIFKGDRRCKVAGGEWLALFTNTIVTDPGKLDVDHMVPLKNAHDSGGWAWEKVKKSAYANDLVYSGHLIAVTASANRRKGAKGPDEWKPDNRDYWCDYAVDWLQIKADWRLSVTSTEMKALYTMIETCADERPITVITYKSD